MPASSTGKPKPASAQNLPGNSHTPVDLLSGKTHSLDSLNLNHQIDIVVEHSKSLAEILCFINNFKALVKLKDHLPITKLILPNSADWA